VFNIQGEDLSQDDIIIAVMGPTGSGKSSFIDKATEGEGHGAAIGHKLESCTQKVGVVKYRCQGHNIVFVDTPGFDDTYKTDFEILDLIAEWLQKTYKCDIKLAGILYLHAITNNRMTGTLRKNLKMFKQLCGADALSNVILVTTMWRDASEDRALERQKELESIFWKDMVTKGSKVFRYDDNYDSAWSILDHFLEPARKRQAVQLQTEMVDLKRRLPHTKAGMKLFEELEAFLQHRKESLEKMQNKMKSHAGDGEDDSLLAREREIREEIAVTVAQMGKLSISLGRRLFLNMTSPSYGNRS